MVKCHFTWKGLEVNEERDEMINGSPRGMAHRDKCCNIWCREHAPGRQIYEACVRLSGRHTQRCNAAGDAGEGEPCPSPGQGETQARVSPASPARSVSLSDFEVCREPQVRKRDRMPSREEPLESISQRKHSTWDLRGWTKGKAFCSSSWISSARLSMWRSLRDSKAGSVKGPKYCKC